MISEIKPKDFFFPHVQLSMLRTGKAWLYVPSRYRQAVALPPSLLVVGKSSKLLSYTCQWRFFSSLSSGWSFYVRYRERGKQMGWTHVHINCSQWNITLYMSTSQWISARSPRSHKGEHHPGYRKWQQISFVVAVTADDSCHSVWTSTSVAQKKDIFFLLTASNWLVISFCEDWGYGLTRGTTGPHILLWTFCWDICKSVLVWAGPVEGLELTLLEKHLLLQLFLNFLFVVGGRLPSTATTAMTSKGPGQSFLIKSTRILHQLQTCWERLIFSSLRKNCLWGREGQ